MEHPEQIAPAWETAFAADRPVVIDALTDPDVPTLPPHITMKQVKSYAMALLKGDPDTGGILWHTLKRS